MTRGRISRAEYLDRSLSRQQPWASEGISRRTWERRRRLQNNDASPLAASPDQAAVATPVEDVRRLDEARAGVEAIYRQMEAERERRPRWWAQQVDEAPDRIAIPSILTGETVVIRLDGAAAHRKRKPAEPARFWWDE
ncbi:MAG: hypothetical protein U1E25_14980 [Methylocystis sp.]